MEIIQTLPNDAKFLNGLLHIKPSVSTVAELPEPHDGDMVFIKSLGIVIGYKGSWCWPQPAIPITLEMIWHKLTGLEEKIDAGNKNISNPYHAPYQGPTYRG